MKPAPLDSGDAVAPRPDAQPFRDDGSAVPAREVEPKSKVLLWALVIAALLPRLAVLPFNENLYGDAVIRTELGGRWAANPHWIASFTDGAFQFGPLHLYLLGIALSIWPVAEHVGRVVSLIFGVLTVIPLFHLTRQLLGWRAALWAGLAFSVWGMHIQFSTTAGSEALALFLVVWTLSLFAAGVEEGRIAPVLYSALVLNLACATRYDAWLLIPLLALALLLGDKDRVAAIARATFFLLLCVPFPMVWMQGNELATGSPLAPIHHIEQFHRAWVSDGLGRLGPILYRLQNLFFWPGVALLTLTPLVALFGMAGMVRAWRERPNQRWLIWIACVPAAYFTFRGTVLMNFQPLARFTATQLVLLLPFVQPGFTWAMGGAGARLRGFVTGVTLALALGIPAAIGAYTFRTEGKYQDTIRPISPISTNPESVMRVARFIKEEVAPRAGAVILDDDEIAFTDMQIAFFCGLPEERMARYRWEIFPERLRSANPDFLVRIDGGKLAENPDFEVIDNRVRLGERWFEELPGFAPPFHVYRRR